MCESGTDAKLIRGGLALDWLLLPAAGLPPLLYFRLACRATKYLRPFLAVLSPPKRPSSTAAALLLLPLAVALRLLAVLIYHRSLFAIPKLSHSNPR